jgi:uncharacterized protein (DUF58 family)
VQRVRALELVARRNVSSLLTGNYLTTIIGSGLDFHEARRYVQGESIRQIDWKITARLCEPYVKTYREEREREVFLAVDVSPSMYTGWQQRSKLETAVETAATLAVSAVDAGDRLGLVTFSDQAGTVLRPDSGKDQLLRVLQELVSCGKRAPQPCAVSDPRAAIHTIQRFRGRRFVVFIISDFIDRDVPDDLTYIRLRHDVSLLHIYDPLEYLSSRVVRLPACSPEGDTTPTVLRPGETGDLESMVGYLRQQAARHRIAVASLSTRDPVGRSLAGFFHQKRRRVV